MTPDGGARVRVVRPRGRPRKYRHLEDDFLALFDAGASHGQIATALGITRSQVWALVQQMRADVASGTPYEQRFRVVKNGKRIAASEELRQLLVATASVHRPKKRSDSATCKCRHSRRDHFGDVCTATDGTGAVCECAGFADASQKRPNGKGPKDALSRLPVSLDAPRPNDDDGRSFAESSGALAVYDGEGDSEKDALYDLATAEIARLKKEVADLRKGLIVNV